MESCKKHDDRIPTRCLFCIIEEQEKKAEELKDIIVEIAFSLESAWKRSKSVVEGG